MNKILCEYQFVFRKHHSKVIALMEVIGNIYHHLGKHEFVIGFFKILFVFCVLTAAYLAYST